MHPGAAPLWGPRTIARYLAGAPRPVRSLALAAFAAAIPIAVVVAGQSGTRQPVSERTAHAAGPLGAAGADALSAAQPACATGSAARPSIAPCATSHCAPDSPRASAIASGDQACGRRSPVHAACVRRRFLAPRARQARATRPRAPRRCPRSPRHPAEAVRRAARARAAAAPRSEKTEPSAPAGAPPTPSKETPVQCSRP